MLPLRARHHWSKLFTLALVLCVLLFTSFASQANPRMNERQQREQPERRQEQARARISAAQAAALVEQRYGGKVMGVQTRQSGGGVVYSVKILQSSGHMRTVNVDGQSGAILN